MSIFALTAIASGSWWFLRAQTRAPVAAVDRFLDDLERGKYDEAYTALCAEDRQRMPRSDFSSSVSSVVAGLETHDAFSFDLFGARRDVHYSLSYPDRTDAFDVVAVHERGAWRVCDFLQ